MQTPNQIINSGLNEYVVEIISYNGDWQRSIVMAPDLATARCLAKDEKARFLAPRADKRAKTLVKRQFIKTKIIC